MRRTLKKLSLILLMSLASAGAYAETGGGVTMSTDPAKAAAVEKHAQELQAHQSKEAASKPAPAHTSSKSSKNTKSTKKTTAKAPATHKSTTKPASTTKPDSTTKPAAKAPQS